MPVFWPACAHRGDLTTKGVTSKAGRAQIVAVLAALALMSLPQAVFASQAGTVAAPRLVAREPDDTFWQQVNEGIGFAQSGQYRQALHAFEQAYQRSPARDVLLNIVTCRIKLGEGQECMDWILRITQGADAAIQSDAEYAKGICRTAKEKADLARRNQELVRAQSARRPLWRIGLGIGLLGAGGILAGFGIPALAISGRCLDSSIAAPQVCPELYDTTGLGAGLTVSGVLLLIGGGITLALPPKEGPQSALSSESGSGKTLSWRLQPLSSGE